MKPIFIELKELPKLQNKKKGVHWAYINKIRKDFEERLKASLIDVIPLKPWSRAKIRYVRYSSVCPDYDGLVDSFKQLQDCLVNIGIIEGDSMKHIGRPDYDWIKTDPGKGKVTIAIHPVFDDNIKI